MQTTVPTLDSALSKPCDKIEEPKDDSVDSLIEAYLDLTKKYADCSAKHNATVNAWQKLQ